MTVGKSLASGMPLAGVVGRADVIDAVHVGGLGSTYGGNPVACAAGVESLKAITDPAFLQAAADHGVTIQRRLHEMADRIDCIGEVRGTRADGRDRAGRGSRHQGACRPAIAAATVAGALERGLILLKTGIYDNVIRILVPVNASDDDLNAGLDILEESLRRPQARPHRFCGCKDSVAGRDCGAWRHVGLVASALMFARGQSRRLPLLRETRALWVAVVLATYRRLAVTATTASATSLASLKAQARAANARVNELYVASERRCSTTTPFTSAT